MNIYVASSWRNEHYTGVVAGLKERGYELYDFRNPTCDNESFHWSQISAHWENWDPFDYRDALRSYSAVAAFGRDYRAVQWADVFVGVMPFGRSASMEMGWAAGQGKKTVLYLPDKIEPELMVKMFNYICVTPHELYNTLRAMDIAANPPQPQLEPLTDITCRLIGTSGNAVALIGRVRDALRRGGRPDLLAPFTTEATGGDYNNVLATCHKYVKVV